MRDMRIDIEKITDRQKLAIEKGLCDYRYIMNHWKENSDDFQEIFYGFYLKARWATMNKPGNRKPYFEKLQSAQPMDSLIDIIDDLHESMESHTYEFSLASKLLHTRNDTMPIYDKKVREYLSKCEGVRLWRQCVGAPRGVSDREKILHDWMLLQEWYDRFLGSVKGEQWVVWFDESFPQHTNISDVKKVDFIIFATN